MNSRECYPFLYQGSVNAKTMYIHIIYKYFVNAYILAVTCKKLYILTCKVRNCVHETLINMITFRW